MGGKSSGGFSADPMIEYGKKALKLQERMYDEGVERTEPFYQGGLGAFDVLLDQMGISGGSVKTRDQLMNSMKDQYTTTQTTGGDSTMLITPDGQVLSSRDALQSHRNGAHGWGAEYANMGDEGTFDFLQGQGYKAFSPSQTSTSTDTDALNAAVDSAYANQGDVPDNFGALMENFSLDKFQADPGYQFRLDEGKKALERSASARGQYYDPSTVKALTDYNSNMADQTFGDAYNRYNNDQNSIFNRLAAVSGIGQTANGQLVQQGQNYANQAGNIYGQMGNAITAANTANASQPSMFDSLLGAGVQLGGAAIMRSDIRLKENIVPDGVENGYKMYKFNYINIPEKTYRGVMAQDIEKIKPEAVIESEGYKKVNYDLLGIQMTEAQ